MKTKLATVIIALFMVQAATAQFHLGIKGGANVTKVDGKSFNQAFRYGYHIGGFAEIGISPKFRIVPEVLFNQYSTTLDSNYKEIYQNVISSDQSKVKLNYLSIPILLDYKLLGPIHLQAGPQVGILMDQSRTFLQNGGDAFKHGDFSMLGGVQLNLAKLRITGRYIIGLNNINDIDNQDQWKSQAVQLSVGLAL
ncbi:MAG: outer membrane beta-barrel protein [Terrimonas sp.]|nr:outer membrane beta-barrel protein [Terrimonas sp.]